MPHSHELPAEQILSVSDLNVRFRQPDSLTQAVQHLSFTLDCKQTLAIVGESDSGKSVTALALMRLLGDGAGVEVNSGPPVTSPRIY